MTPHKIFLSLPGFKSPSDENIDKTKIPELADVMKKVHKRQIAMIEKIIPNGYSARTTNSAVSVTSFALLIIPISRFNPKLPKIENQIKETIDGAMITPKTNSLIVLPLEILAIKVPTNGPQAIHHDQ